MPSVRYDNYVLYAANDGFSFIASAAETWAASLSCDIDVDDYSVLSGSGPSPVDVGSVLQTSRVFLDADIIVASHEMGLYHEMAVTYIRGGIVLASIRSGADIAADVESAGPPRAALDMVLRVLEPHAADSGQPGLVRGA